MESLKTVNGASENADMADRGWLTGRRSVTGHHPLSVNRYPAAGAICDPQLPLIGTADGRHRNDGITR